MNIDEVVLNFTPGTLVILNMVLGLIMFGIALDTSPDDFKVVFRHPKPFIIAILAQLLVLNRQDQHARSRLDRAAA